MIARLWRMALYAIPRTIWTVVERDGHAEFVIWRQWRGRAYDINSVLSMPGRYDRETCFGRLDSGTCRDPSMQPDLSVVHVVPINDLIEHEAEDDECMCGPDVEYVEGGKVVTHHSLDGREEHEGA